MSLTSNTVLDVALLPRHHLEPPRSQQRDVRVVTKVHIVGTYAGSSAKFVVTIGGQLLVNDTVGTASNLTVDDGIYTTSGGLVQITNSAGVAWTFTESR
jgi:hypothetical protein